MHILRPLIIALSLLALGACSEYKHSTSELVTGTQSSTVTAVRFFNNADDQAVTQVHILSTDSEQNAVYNLRGFLRFVAVGNSASLTHLARTDEFQINSKEKHETTRFVTRICITDEQQKVHCDTQMRKGEVTLNP